jgi:DNA-binding XRE family transcriptional regulator
MDGKEFVRIRHALEKTQNQMGRILCVSPKAIQSFEQQWRKIPSYIEREMLLFLSLKTSFDRNIRPCWEIKNCPDTYRNNCVVWELQARHFCWFINGTFCQGKVHKNWNEKIQLCRECEVYNSMLPEYQQLS